MAGPPWYQTAEPPCDSLLGWSPLWNLKGPLIAQYCVVLQMWVPTGYTTCSQLPRPLRVTGYTYRKLTKPLFTSGYQNHTASAITWSLLIKNPWTTILCMCVLCMLDTCVSVFILCMCVHVCVHTCVCIHVCVYILYVNVCECVHV